MFFLGYYQHILGWRRPSTGTFPFFPLSSNVQAPPLFSLLLPARTVPALVIM